MLEQNNSVVADGWSEFQPPYTMDEEDETPYGEEGSQEPSNEDDTDEDLLTSLLKNIGISDPNKIVFENEDGTSEEVPFNSLTKQEQLDLILESTKADLHESDAEILSYLKARNLTIEDAIEFAKKEGIREYLESNKEGISYRIDDFTDDQLYFEDLKQRFPNLTDEELVSKLEHSKTFPSYQKEAEQLRQHYKKLEEDQIKIEEEKEQRSKDEFFNDLKRASDGFKTWRFTDEDVLHIDDGERTNILKYITDTDATGATKFIQDIQNPDKLFKMAYLSVYGDDLLRNLHKYYKAPVPTPKPQERVIVNSTKPKERVRTTVVEDPSW